MSTHSAGAVGSARRCSVTLPWGQCKSRLCAVTVCKANCFPLKGGGQWRWGNSCIFLLIFCSMSNTAVFIADFSLPNGQIKLTSHANELPPALSD